MYTYMLLHSFSAAICGQWKVSIHRHCSCHWSSGKFVWIYNWIRLTNRTLTIFFIGHYYIIQLYPCSCRRVRYGPIPRRKYPWPFIPKRQPSIPVQSTVMSQDVRHAYFSRWRGKALDRNVDSPLTRSTSKTSLWTPPMPTRSYLRTKVPLKRHIPFSHQPLSLGPTLRLLRAVEWFNQGSCKPCRYRFDRTNWASLMKNFSGRWRERHTHWSSA